MPTILALDLGTNTGWALWKDGVLTSGAWELMTKEEVAAMRKAKLDRTADPRFKRLAARLKEIGFVHYLYFEDVQFLSSQLQSQLWAGLRTVVLFSESGELAAIPVGTLKKFATGDGHADKEQMGAALIKKYPHLYYAGVTPRGRKLVMKRGSSVEVGDDEADALHLIGMALNQHNLA